jgi:hypothetical protein
MRYQHPTSNPHPCTLWWCLSTLEWPYIKIRYPQSKGVVVSFMRDDLEQEENII